MWVNNAEKVSLLSKKTVSTAALFLTERIDNQQKRDDVCGVFLPPVESSIAVGVNEVELFMSEQTHLPKGENSKSQHSAISANFE